MQTFIYCGATKIYLVIQHTSVFNTGIRIFAHGMP